MARLKEMMISKDTYKMFITAPNWKQRKCLATGEKEDTTIHSCSRALVNSDKQLLHPTRMDVTVALSEVLDQANIVRYMGMEI